MLFNALLSNIPVISWQEQVTFWWDDDDISVLLDQHTWFDLYSASLLKQQSVAAHRHISLILSQPVYALNI